MRIVLQRVNSAKVTVESETVGEIRQGLLLLVGIGQDDTEAKLKPMAEKVCNLRIFKEGDKHFHLSLNDIKGEVLLVSQFTLFADCSKGRRPEFFGAMKPDEALRLFNQFVNEFKNLGVPKVQTGSFGAYMKVTSENDGPVTIILEA